MASPHAVDPPPESNSGKSPEAFRTISEVATELDLPQHVLRFWETRFATIRPLKRSGGRRYYRPEDIALLRRIRDLLRDKGYTIKGVQKLLRQGGERTAPMLAAEAQPTLFRSISSDEPAARLSRAGVDAADDDAPAPRDPSPPAADEGPAISATAREELQGILSELEALSALVKSR